MPSTLHAPLVLLTLFWTAFFLKLYRSARAGKISNSLSRSLWFSYFLGGLVITFSGKDVEYALDRMAGGLPIAVYTKFVCALLIIHTLYFMLRPTIGFTRWKDRLLSYGCVITIVVGLISFPAFIMLPPDMKEQAHYALIALRDLVIGSYMVVAFIPTTYKTWRKEVIIPMKLKHFVGLLFDLSYLLLALGNVLTFIASFWSRESAAFVDLSFKPAISLCVLFFMISALPHRVLAWLFLPQRWWLLRRLRYLELKIASFSERLTPTQAKTSLEGQIYRTVISILDHYVMLQRGSNQHLYFQIAGIVSLYPDYSQLVEQLAKLS